MHADIFMSISLPNQWLQFETMLQHFVSVKPLDTVVGELLSTSVCGDQNIHCHCSSMSVVCRNTHSCLFFFFFPTIRSPDATPEALTHSYGVSVAFVVDAEPPKPLIGGAARVSILHPEVCCCRNDEKHEGSHAAERASSRQSVQHPGEAGRSAVVLNIQQLLRGERTEWRKVQH